jgi:hypothetical protein
MLVKNLIEKINGSIMFTDFRGRFRVFSSPKGINEELLDLEVIEIECSNNMINIIVDTDMFRF